ncbi:lysosome-associated membrane glycoprotein 1-like [Rhodnius prolixus]
MLMPKYIFLILHAVIVLGKKTGEEPLDSNSQVENLTADNAVTTIKPTTGSTSLNPSSVAPPITTTSTVAPPITTTSTVAPPITTTPTAPNVTTVPSTTAVPIVSSTTSIPQTDRWMVSQNGTVCIIAKMKIKVDLKLDAHSKDISMEVPKTAQATGNCGAGEQSMVLTWDKNQLTFLFKANKTLDKYRLDTVSIDINTENVTVQQSDGNITMFETALNHSYSCSYSDPLKLTNNTKTIEFSFSNIELAAFRKDNTTSFSNVSACPPDTPDIVPIVVGCALTVLVVVVLIAYLYGRRRTQARGYLSM